MLRAVLVHKSLARPKVSSWRHLEHGGQRKVLENPACQFMCFFAQFDAAGRVALPGNWQFQRVRSYPACAGNVFVIGEVIPHSNRTPAHRHFLTRRNLYRMTFRTCARADNFSVAVKRLELLGTAPVWTGRIWQIERACRRYQ